MKNNLTILASIILAVVASILFAPKYPIREPTIGAGISGMKYTFSTNRNINPPLGIIRIYDSNDTALSDVYLEHTFTVTSDLTQEVINNTAKRLMLDYQQLRAGDTEKDAQTDQVIETYKDTYTGPVLVPQSELDVLKP